MSTRKKPTSHAIAKPSNNSANKTTSIGDATLPSTDEPIAIGDPTGTYMSENQHAAHIEASGLDGNSDVSAVNSAGQTRNFTRTAWDLMGCESDSHGWKENVKTPKEVTNLKNKK